MGNVNPSGINPVATLSKGGKGGFEGVFSDDNLVKNRKAVFARGPSFVIASQRRSNLAVVTDWKTEIATSLRSSQ